MKKQLFLCAVILLFSKIAFSQWQPTNDSTSVVSCFAAKDNNIFAGTDSTLLLSTDYGTNWIIKENGLPNIPVRSILIDDINVFVSTGNFGAIGDGVYLSTNNGDNWTPLNTGLPLNHSSNALAMNDGRLFVGIQDCGIYFSDDTGASWTLSDFTNKCVYAFAIQDTNILAGTYDYGMYRSTNNGLNWSNFFLYTPQSVNAIGINGTNIFASTFYSLYVSTDNGQNWTETGPLGAHFYSFIPYGNDIIGAADEYGVYLFTNNGSNWTQINDGLPQPSSVNSLGSDGTNIYAGTGYSGIWKRPLSEIAGITTNIKNGNINIYPNPAKDKINISIDEPYAIFEIFDMTGKVLMRETLNNAKSVDIGNLENGIYFVRITTDKHVYSEKVIKE